MTREYWKLLEDIGAVRIPHSGRTLLDHLKGTYDLLNSWGCRPATCRAGLFHSVYGTKTFNTSLLDLSERFRVRDVIGTRAERLVFIFAVCDRDAFFDNLGIGDTYLCDTTGKRQIEATHTTIKALVEIEVANMLEQIPHKGRISRRVMQVYMRQYVRARGVIPSLAQRHAERVLRRYEPRFGRDFRSTPAL